MIRLYMNKKFKKKNINMDTILFLVFIRFVYILIKKNGKLIFKVYGIIIIDYRYLGSKKNPNFVVRVELLKNKLKKKFR